MSRLTYRDEHGTAKLFQETLRRNPHAFAEKLAHYEDLEEQGRLISLPCAIGDDVYKVPSETNYKLNVLGGHEEHNKAYHQKVVAIEIKKDCWFMVGSTDAEYGTGRLFLDVDFGETWFLTKAEAEQKLAELQSFPTLPILHGNVAPASREDAMERLGLREKLAELKGENNA